MKAIHNNGADLAILTMIGNYKLKYNFESNSQHAIVGDGDFQIGNYKLKYNFESNSQQSQTIYVDLVDWEL